MARSPRHFLNTRSRRYEADDRELTAFQVEDVQGLAAPVGPFRVEVDRSTAVLSIIALCAAMGLSALLLGVTGSGRATRAGQSTGEPRMQASSSKHGFRLGEVTTQTSYVWCNISVSPAPVGGGASEGATKAFEGFEAGSPGDMYPRIQASDAAAGTAVVPTVEYRRVSDPDYGPIVDGVVQPVYSDTPEWIIVYAHVPIEVTPPVATASDTGRTAAEITTVVVLIDPSSYDMLSSNLCGP